MTHSIADLPARIASKLRLQLNVAHLGPCWVPERSINSKGYSQIRWDGKVACLHRVTYKLLVDPSFVVYAGKAGTPLDHRCFVRCCSNPAHLEAVSTAENNRRSLAQRARPLGVAA